MGGGIGFLSVCDAVYAKRTCFFALSEVKLGVIPATISPCAHPAAIPPTARAVRAPRLPSPARRRYVVAKIGPAATRRLFATGQAIQADEALRCAPRERHARSAPTA